MNINTILQGNSLDVLKTLPDNSVDCCISSPPYWGLRDYGCDGQLGNEPKFGEYIENLVNIYTEVKRVLRPAGTCFVNLGDTYAGSGGWSEFKDTWKPTKQLKNKSSNIEYSKQRIESVPNKCLNMIPERFAIAMIGADWILRNQIIWHKPNQMPSSVKDRFTVDFEKIFFFTKQGDYYFEQQFEKATSTDLTIRNRETTKLNNTPGRSRMGGLTSNHYTERNMRTVWSINTLGCSDAHFATYPQRLVEIMIKSGCPEQGIVLDPFFGSGTTGIYARKCDRNYLGIELNPEYVKIAENRLYKEIGMFL